MYSIRKDSEEGLSTFVNCVPQIVSGNFDMYLLKQTNSMPLNLGTTLNIEPTAMRKGYVAVNNKNLLKKT